MLNFEYSERFSQDEIEELGGRIKRVLQGIPELESLELSLTVERISKKITRLYAEAFIQPMPIGILRVKSDVPHFTLGHELTHLLQQAKKIPDGEFENDVFVLSKSLLFSDSIPVYFCNFVIILPYAYRKINRKLSLDLDDLINFFEDCYTNKPENKESKSFRVYLANLSKKVAETGFSEDEKLKAVIECYNYIARENQIDFNELMPDDRKKILDFLRKQEKQLINWNSFI
jgi:hypothetical protein